MFGRKVRMVHIRLFACSSIAWRFTSWHSRCNGGGSKFLLCSTLGVTVTVDSILVHYCVCVFRAKSGDEGCLLLLLKNYDFRERDRETMCFES